MNRLTSAEERQRNSDALHRFYYEVLHAFIFKLEQEHRYRRTLSEEQIQAIEQRVKAKINLKNKHVNSFDKFTSYLKMKETSIKQEVKSQMESNYSKEKNEPITEMGVKVEQPAKVEVKKQVVQEQEEDDDLAYFCQRYRKGKEQQGLWKQIVLDVKSQAKSKYESKVESTEKEIKQSSSQTQQKKDEKEQASQNESEEDDKEAQLFQRVNQRIGTGLLGTFSSFHIKRKPKEQKIFLDIENVFVKYAHTPFENYFARINCQFSKIEKEDIRQLRK